MSLSRLPPELLINIADHITDSEGKCRYADLNSLVRANRVFYVFLNTILWKQALKSKHKTKLTFRSLVTRDTKNLSRLRFFLELGANIETPLWKDYVDGKPFFSTPLIVAARMNNLPAARLLLEKGANLRKDSSSPGALACSSVMHAAQSAEMVQILLDHGADIEEEEFGFRPLHAYTVCNDISSMRVVLQGGAEVDSVSSRRRRRDRPELTPLHFAVGRSVDAVKLLLEFGADFKRLAVNRNTSWHLAAAAGKTDVLRLLWKLWPEGIREKNCLGNTPLHVATREAKTDPVKLLALYWPEGIGEKDRFCLDTPLHDAAAKGEIDVLNLLTKLWPEAIRTKDRCGNTPLHVAAKQGKTDALRVLTRIWPEGIREKNCNGHMPLDIAEKGRKTDASLLDYTKRPPRQELVAAFRQMGPL